MKQLLKLKIEEIDKSLKKFVGSCDNPQKEIYDSAEYSLFAGGKRLRPILTLETYKMCGGDKAGIMNFACAVEMIHTYSLIHDDLPSMDNDDFRRGRPTNHKVYGEAMAILTGDGLLNRAFEIALECCDIEPDRVIEAVRILSKNSGWFGMIGGQVVDIANEGKQITLEELQYIHKLKTGALIKASCLMGAVLAGCENIEAIEKYAQYLGIAFQIQDDILDVVGDEKALGKPIGSDEKNNKTTYVTICGIEKAKEYAKEYFDKALCELKPFGENAEFLKKFTAYLCDRNS